LKNQTVHHQRAGEMDLYTAELTGKCKERVKSSFDRYCLIVRITKVNYNFRFRIRRIYKNFLLNFYEETIIQRFHLVENNWFFLLSLCRYKRKIPDAQKKNGGE
jgi:hypothetical protein